MNEQQQTKYQQLKQQYNDGVSVDTGWYWFVFATMFSMGCSVNEAHKLALNIREVER